MSVRMVFYDDCFLKDGVLIGRFEPHKTVSREIRQLPKSSLIFSTRYWNQLYSGQLTCT